MNSAKGIMVIAVGIALFMLLATGWAPAGQVDKYLKELSSDDREVRANAAYELGCG